MNILQRENFKLRDRIVDLKGEIEHLQAHLKMEKATLADWGKITTVRIDRIKELEIRLGKLTMACRRQVVRARQAEAATETLLDGIQDQITLREANDRIAKIYAGF